MPQSPSSSGPSYDLLFRILTPIATALFGAAIAYNIEKYKNRILILKKNYNVSLVGMTRASDEWGNIEMVWNGSTVNNLYVYNAWLYNTSSQDAPADMKVLFSVPKGCYLLRQAAYVANNDTTLSLLLESKWLDGLLDARAQWATLSEEEKTKNPLQYQKIDHYDRHLLYQLPYLNRKSGIASFTFLVGAHQVDDAPPVLSIGIHQPGIKLEVLEDKKYSAKTIRIIQTIEVFLAVLSAFPTIKYAPTITWAVWVMIGNMLLAGIIPRVGAYILKSLRLLK